MRAAIACLASLAILSACTDPATPEDRIRAFMSEIERASRDKDVSAVKNAISENYRDAHGRLQRDIHSIITLQYLRQREIYLLTRIESLELPSPTEAHVVVLGAMAGTPIEAADALRKIRADVYRFDLQLRDERGSWRVVSGDWRPAILEDFF
jgi:hypothetical protein